MEQVGSESARACPKSNGVTQPPKQSLLVHTRMLCYMKLGHDVISGWRLRRGETVDTLTRTVSLLIERYGGHNIQCWIQCILREGNTHMWNQQLSFEIWLCFETWCGESRGQEDKRLAKPSIFCKICTYVYFHESKSQERLLREVDIVFLLPTCEEKTQHLSLQFSTVQYTCILEIILNFGA